MVTFVHGEITSWLPLYMVRAPRESTLWLPLYMVRAPRESTLWLPLYMVRAPRGCASVHYWNTWTSGTWTSGKLKYRNVRIIRQLKIEELGDQYDIDRSIRFPDIISEAIFCISWSKLEGYLSYAATLLSYTAPY